MFLKSDLGLRFDVIIGNPPYSTESDSKQLNRKPIYQRFFNFCDNSLESIHLALTPWENPEEVGNKAAVVLHGIIKILISLNILILVKSI